MSVEIGPGSGIITATLARVLNHSSAHLTLDLNPRACLATQLTFTSNSILLGEVVRTDLTSGTRLLKGMCDVLIFNPPYVPDGEEGEIDEVDCPDIRAAWAGGDRGRQVLDRLLPDISSLLSSRGVFYLVGVEENDPQGIAQALSLQGLECEVVAQRRAYNELLFVLKAWKE